MLPRLGAVEKCYIHTPVIARQDGFEPITEEMP